LIFRKLIARFRRATAVAAFALLLGANAQQTPAQDHSMDSDHTGHEAMSMAIDGHMQMDASDPSKLLADKKESEFNHHLAGLLIILAGLFILAQGKLPQRWSFLRFAWPSCFLLSGLFCSSSATRSCGHSVPRVGGSALRTIPKTCSTRRLR